MIKINFSGGQSVELDNINDAKEILGISFNKPADKENPGDTLKGSMAYKNNGSYTKKTTKVRYSKWLPEEISFMIKNIDLGHKSLINTDILRNRHSQKSVYQMLWKITKNPKNYKISNENQALIDEYHRYKPTKLNVNHLGVGTFNLQKA